MPGSNPIQTSAMLDSEAETGTSKSRGVAPSAAQVSKMTAKEKAAYKKQLAAKIASGATTTAQAIQEVQNAVDNINSNLNAIGTAGQTAEGAASAANTLMQQAAEQEDAAKIANELAKSEADKAAALATLEAAKKAAAEAQARAKAELEAQIKAAEAAAAAAKKAAEDAAAAAKKAADEAAAKAAEAAKNAADAAAKAAADKAKADYEAALKAAQEAAGKANAEAAAAAAAVAAAKAQANINTSGNVITTVPGPYPTSAGPASAADILAKQYAEQQAAAEKQKAMDRQNIIDVLSSRLKQYNLSSLLPTITRLAQDGASEATITLALQETPEYQQRFAANQERIKKGLQVLSPAEYLNVEDSYRQILRAYGLTQFDNDQYVKQFISNDMSPAELSNRVVAAVQRVRNADPAITRTLQDYYGIASGDLVAYVLDPNQQYQKIERQISAAEIGTAARKQGLEAGVAVSEQLAAQGISQAEAQKGYATIADILPTAEKLSAIYGTEAPYNQATAEQEVFNQLASAQRKRQRLTQAEIAQFSGQAGASRVALTSPGQGQI